VTRDAVTRAVPVFLTGFMATGKSKIGRLLASRMRRIFIDTDDMIEARAGKAIAAIFADEGEERFRALERECVVEAASQAAVIALGGGAIAQEENWKAIGDTDGILICLEADVDTILERVSRRDTRPLLAGLSHEEKREKITAMLAERAPYYRRAHITVRSSEDRRPVDTVTELLDLLQRRAKC
jgi:shikimate kinase